ncbi:MAG TPA: glycosyltransferase [Solirubrobacteraceae bacterium]|nr:glycosyltransferase [Solirubrobacteraceae bacterium]
MRVLIFHGYLLRGTGSNVYNANLSAALVRQGHEVHLLSQERAAEEFDFVDAVGDWDGGALRITTRHEPARCTVYRPDIGGLLPVYVTDRYEGTEARAFPELSDAELDRYLERNVAAVAEVAARVNPDVALANHLVMGPLILARALADSGVPYAVKIHGSALEYTVKPHPRFLPYAREGVAAARGVLVGSRHTAESLWAAVGDPTLEARTRLGPPGVDVAAFGPRPPEAAAAGLRALADRLGAETPPPAGAGGGFARDPAGAAAALAAFEPGRDRLVAFVGKLIVSKGIDLLLAAWPLVLARVPAARLVVVGFGGWSDAALVLVRALGAGDLAAARSLAEAGRESEGGPRAPLRHLLAFLDRLEADSQTSADYLAAAARLTDRVAFAGRLEHAELVDVLPACEVLVVPSTFPESFGMVAAEAAAAGALPVSAEHSGLAEVSRVLAAAVPPPARPWLAFPIGDGAVEALASRLVGWLEAPAELRSQTREALVATARERYSWEGVADGVIAAAEGRLDELQRP